MLVRFARCTDIVNITLLLLDVPKNRTMFCKPNLKFIQGAVAAPAFDGVLRKKTASLLHTYTMSKSCKGILKAIADRPYCPIMLKYEHRISSTYIKTKSIFISH